MSSDKSRIVYESPDSGKTVRPREFGRIPDFADDGRVSELAEAHLWDCIRELAKSNVPLQTELDRVKILYYLIKTESESDE